MRDLKKLWLVGLIATFVLIGGGSCDNCNQPQITSMNPTSGPGGTIVEVVYSGGGVTGTVIFDGSSVETRSASSIGLSRRLRFTVPYNATAGSKNVQVRSEGGTSPADTFNVTGPGTVPVPVLDGWETANSNGFEISVFGSNFSTLSKVYVNGTEVKSYHGNQPPIRLLPFDFVDNVIICLPETALTQGSSYSIQVKNPNNKNSNILNVTVPTRECKMEFLAIQGVPVPDYYVWQNNTVNTFRRSYTTCGWILDLDDMGTNITDPQSGNPFSYADLYSFWQAHANVPISGYYMAGIYIADGPTARGVMFMNTGRIPSLPSANYRQGFACFWDDFAVYTDRQQRYIRTAMHEAGHGFNLLHSDASLNRTLMTTTPLLAAGWHCFFSNTSCTHLQSHNINAVAPGGEAFGSSRSCNSLH